MSSDSDSIAVRRSRREKKQSVAASALEKIRRNRETGVHEESELETPKAVFDYVDEDEYARIVQERQEEGFILDDDGSYNEHGREMFDEEIDPTPKSRRGDGGKKLGVVKHVAKPTSNIKLMLMSRGDSKKKKKKEASASLKDDQLLADVLKQIGERKPTMPSNRGVGHRGRPVASIPPVVTPHRPSPQFTPRQPSTPHSSHQMPTKRIRVVRPDERQAKQAVRKVSPPPPSPPIGGEGDWCGEWEGDADVLAAMEDKGVTDVKEERMEEEEKGEPMEVGPKPVVPEAAVSTGGWETVRGELLLTQETLSSVQVDSSSLPTTEIDGVEVLPFFWLDAYEDPIHQPGTVYLFGKVWVQEVHTHVSCCVVVKNIDRCLYFLPREKMLSKTGKPTDKDVTFEDVYREFQDRYAEPCRMMKFTSKRVTKKYAFDLPNVPRESEYLEVQYSAQYPAPPMNTSGQTFSHVFGANTSSLERLVLKCGLKGPCWLHINQPVCPSQPVSWCKCEAVVGEMGSVSVMLEQATPPPLVVMSLCLKITLNPKNGTNEVLGVGALIHPSLSLDKPPPKTLFEADFCTIRRPVDRDFPFRFEEFVKRKGFNIEVAPSERAMLAYFLAKLHRVDPDVVVGHNLSSLELEVLQHRMAACKVPQWSRIGRLKRREMPKGRSAQYALCAGRPVCDVKTSAKELIRARSYDLPELVNTVLHEKHAPLDHEDVLKAFGSCEQLGSVVAHTMNEALLSLRLMYELNVLALAYQITCIAGNTLGRTLMGGRAERNEFLLLHAFTTRGYICPDKRPPGKKPQLLEHDADEGEELTKSKGRRKPAYSGGLVLEPKRGFYDRFILLLDFNSLYPSIMQEYNICFTTLDHAHCPPGEEGLASLRLPDPSEPLGVLPSEIRVLVERRRQVKQLMKGAQGNREQYQQYDIRQKALKLTANSMYGCLGFANSRFHAQPLAALITSKGREILSHTKELAQKLNLDVIYGDTDSIMIDSNTRDLAEAERIAQQVKVEVNKLYRLLEIDVDGIFKSMLLLKKKKYAAVAVEWRDGHKVERRELKGLDIVRRDWCGLAKTTGHYVLDQILSGDPLDEVIEKIQEYLHQVHTDVVGGKVPLEQFVITKSLSKLPADYPDKKNLPHVQVALRMMSRNVHVQPGDVIPYIMCQGESSQSAALRAFHPDEVGKQDHLKVDTRYYLQHQLQAVVSRICEPIEGLDAAQIAECLGLDPSSYRSASSRQDDGCEEGMVGSGEGQPSDAKPLFVHCPHCHHRVKVRGSKCPTVREGLCCVDCRKPLGVGRLRNQLTLTTRVFTKKYYAGWLVCEDHSCHFRTRNITISLEEAGPRCPGCHQGRLIEEYPASALYRQLVYFEKIFTRQDDGDYQCLRAHVAALLTQNQYSKVKLARLFPDLR